MAALAACGSGSDCTELGCTNDATVTFPSGTVDGPYDLVIDAGGMALTARCADPGAPEALDNPPELTSCTTGGFTLEGDAAQGHSMRITITPVGMEAVIENTEILLSTVDEFQPNGDGCPPTCFSRTGALGI